MPSKIPMKTDEVNQVIYEHLDTNGVEIVAEAAKSIFEYLDTNGVEIVAEAAKSIFESGGIYRITKDGCELRTNEFQRTKPWAFKRPTRRFITPMLTGRSTNERDEVCKTLRHEVRTRLLGEYLEEKLTEEINGWRWHSILDRANVAITKRIQIWEIMDSAGLDWKWFRRKFDEEIDMEVICRLTDAASPRPLEITIERYFLLKKALPSIIAMEESTPGAAMLYKLCVLNSNSDVDSLISKHPGEIAEIVMSLCEIPKSNWKTISKLSAQKVKDIYRTVYLRNYRWLPDLLELQTTIKKAILTGATRTMASLSHAQYYRADSKARRHSIFRAFVEEHALPKLERLDGSSREELGYMLATVMDWATNTADDFQLGLSWRGYVARARQWHERHDELSKEIRDKQAKCSWVSLFEESVIDAFQIIPLNTGGALIEEGNSMRHCVGTVHYTTACMLGDTRIFSVRTLPNAEGLRIATFDIRKMSNGEWRVGQILGKRNSQVSSELLEIGKEVAKRYGEMERDSMPTNARR